MKTKTTTLQAQAVVKEKRELPYQDIASTKGIPVLKPIYEVIFEAEGEDLLFTLSQFEYEVLEIKDQGLLTYQRKKYCNELISFADKIHEITNE